MLVPETRCLPRIVSLLLVAAQACRLVLLRLCLLLASSAGCGCLRLVRAAPTLVAHRTTARLAAVLVVSLRCSGACASASRLAGRVPLCLVVCVARWRPLLLVLVVRGVQVSVAVASGHRLCLGIATHLNCCCHCSLLDCCLVAVLCHLVAHDAQLGVAGLCRLLLARAQERHLCCAGWSSGRCLRCRCRQVEAVARRNAVGT